MENSRRANVQRGKGKNNSSSVQNGPTRQKNSQSGAVTSKKVGKKSETTQNQMVPGTYPVVHRGQRQKANERLQAYNDANKMYNENEKTSRRSQSDKQPKKNQSSPSKTCKQDRRNSQGSTLKQSSCKPSRKQIVKTSVSFGRTENVRIYHVADHGTQHKCTNQESKIKKEQKSNVDDSKNADKGKGKINFLYNVDVTVGKGIVDDYKDIELSDKDKKAKQKADKEKADKESADREKTEKDKADREKTRKSQAEIAKGDKEITDKEKTDKDKADSKKLSAAKEETGMSESEMEKTQREKAEKEKLAAKLSGSSAKQKKSCSSCLGSTSTSAEDIKGGAKSPKVDPPKGDADAKISSPKQKKSSMSCCKGSASTDEVVPQKTKVPDVKVDTKAPDTKVIVDGKVPKVDAPKADANIKGDACDACCSPKSDKDAKITIPKPKKSGMSCCKGSGSTDEVVPQKPKAPDDKVDTKAPVAKVKVDGKVPKVDPPKVDANIKGDVKSSGVDLPKADIDAKITSPKPKKSGMSCCKGSVSTDVVVPPQKAKVPDVKVDAKAPDAKVEADGQIPKVDAGIIGEAKPSKVDADAKLSTPKPKKSGMSCCKGSASTDAVVPPKTKVDAKAPDASIKVDGGLPKVDPTKADVNAKIESPDMSKKKKGSWSFFGKKPSMAKPDVKVDGKLPKGDVGIKGDVKVDVPKVDVKPPDADVKVDTNIKGDLPKGDVDISKKKKGGLSCFGKKSSTDVPDVKVDANVPKGDVNIKGDVKPPKVDLPRADVDGKVKVDGKLPKIDAPKGAYMNECCLPKTDVKVDAKTPGTSAKVNGQLPKVDANINECCLPKTEAKPKKSGMSCCKGSGSTDAVVPQKPKVLDVKVDAKAPDAKVEADEQLPKVDANIKGEAKSPKVDADAKFSTPKPKKSGMSCCKGSASTDVVGPKKPKVSDAKIDAKAPDADVKVDGKLPKVNSPEVDANIKGEVKPQKVNMPKGDLDAKSPKPKKSGLSCCKGSASTEVVVPQKPPKIDVPKVDKSNQFPEANMEIRPPQVTELPEVPSKGVLRPPSNLKPPVSDKKPTFPDSSVIRPQKDVCCGPSASLIIITNCNSTYTQTDVPLLCPCEKVSQSSQTSRKKYIEFQINTNIKTPTSSCHTKTKAPTNTSPRLRSPKQNPMNQPDTCCLPLNNQSNLTEQCPSVPQASSPGRVIFSPNKPCRSSFEGSQNQRKIPTLVRDPALCLKNQTCYQSNGSFQIKKTGSCKFEEKCDMVHARIAKEKEEEEKLAKKEAKENADRSDQFTTCNSADLCSMQSPSKISKTSIHYSRAGQDLGIIPAICYDSITKYSFLPDRKKCMIAATSYDIYRTELPVEQLSSSNTFFLPSRESSDRRRSSTSLPKVIKGVSVPQSSKGARKNVSKPPTTIPNRRNSAQSSQGRRKSSQGRRTSKGKDKYLNKKPICGTSPCPTGESISSVKSKKIKSTERFCRGPVLEEYVELGLQASCKICYPPERNLDDPDLVSRTEALEPEVGISIRSTSSRVSSASTSSWTSAVSRRSMLSKDSKVSKRTGVKKTAPQYLIPYPKGPQGPSEYHKRCIPEEPSHIPETNVSCKQLPQARDLVSFMRNKKQPVEIKKSVCNICPNTTPCYEMIVTLDNTTNTTQPTKPIQKDKLTKEQVKPKPTPVTEDDKTTTCCGKKSNTSKKPKAEIGLEEDIKYTKDTTIIVQTGDPTDAKKREKKVKLKPIPVKEDDETTGCCGKKKSKTKRSKTKIELEEEDAIYIKDTRVRAPTGGPTNVNASTPQTNVTVNVKVPQSSTTEQTVNVKVRAPHNTASKVKVSAKSQQGLKAGKRVSINAPKSSISKTPNGRISSPKVNVSTKGSISSQKASFSTKAPQGSITSQRASLRANVDVSGAKSTQDTNYKPLESAKPIAAAFKAGEISVQSSPASPKKSGSFTRAKPVTKPLKSNVVYKKNFENVTPDSKTSSKPISEALKGQIGYLVVSKAKSQKDSHIPETSRSKHVSEALKGRVGYPDDMKGKGIGKDIINIPETRSSKPVCVALKGCVSRPDEPKTNNDTKVLEDFTNTRPVSDALKGHPVYMEESKPKGTTKVSESDVGCKPVSGALKGTYVHEEESTSKQTIKLLKQFAKPSVKVEETQTRSISISHAFKGFPVADVNTQVVKKPEELKNFIPERSNTKPVVAAFRRRDIEPTPEPEKETSSCSDEPASKPGRDPVPKPAEKPSVVPSPPRSAKEVSDRKIPCHQPQTNIPSRICSSTCQCSKYQNM